MILIQQETFTIAPSSIELDHSTHQFIVQEAYGAIRKELVRKPHKGVPHALLEVKEFQLANRSTDLHIYAMGGSSAY